MFLHKLLMQLSLNRPSTNIKNNLFCRLTHFRSHWTINVLCVCVCVCIYSCATLLTKAAFQIFAIFSIIVFLHISCLILFHTDGYALNKTVELYNTHCEYLFIVLFGWTHLHTLTSCVENIYLNIGWNMS